MEKMIIKHQLFDSNNYRPNWPLKYLFLGTFNPEGGNPVNYFYGRRKNQTWPTLSKIFKKDLDIDSVDFFQNLQDLGIGCMDLIKSVEIYENDLLKVIGSGYKDSNIINIRCIRNYYTDEILDIISINPELKIYSTWGKGSQLNDWVKEVNKISNIINLASPSLAARVPKGTSKIDYIFDDWNRKINQ